MNKLSLVMGIGFVFAGSAWACGSDVEGSGTTTSTSSSSGGGSSAGGMGGDGGTGGDGGMGGSGASGAGPPTCDGPFDNVCDEGCCIIESQCGASGACALAGQFGYDLQGCGDSVAQCAGNCITANPDCGDILALVNMNFNTTLGQCLLACQSATPCQGCVLSSCPMEFQACAQQMGPCPDFLLCSQACGEDIDCINTCAANNQSTETDNLLTCIGLNCINDCSGQGGGNP
jgi:hypothetical protein